MKVSNESYPFQASVVGLGTIPPCRKIKTNRFDFLHEMADNLKSGQAVRLIVPNRSMGQNALLVWHRIKGKGTPRVSIRKHGVDQYLLHLWFVRAEEPLDKVSYLARVTLIRRIRHGESNDRLF